MEKIGSSPTKVLWLGVENFSDFILISSRIKMAKAGKKNLRRQRQIIRNQRMNLRIQCSLIEVMFSLKRSRFTNNSLSVSSHHKMTIAKLPQKLKRNTSEIFAASIFHQSLPSSVAASVIPCWLCFWSFSRPQGTQ